MAASKSSSVEHDARRDPLVGVDLDDAEHLGVERLGPLVAARVTDATEGEALAAGRNDVDVMFVTPTSAIARKFAISASRPCRTPAFTTRRRSSSTTSSASISAIASQSRAAKYVQRRSYTRLAAFSSVRRRALSSSNLASAASRSASSNSSQRLIRSPSTVDRLISRHSASKPSGEVALRRIGEDRSEVGQPMHSLDVAVRSFGARSHAARMYATSSPGANAVTRRWSTFTQVRRRRGSS